MSRARATVDAAIARLVQLGATVGPPPKLPTAGDAPAVATRGRGFEDDVIRALRGGGWRVAHFRAVRIQRADGSTYYATPVGADGKGFTDLVAVKHRLIFRELKSGSGELEPGQILWRDALLAAGADWAEWRPEDWAEIQRTAAEGG